MLIKVKVIKIQSPWIVMPEKPLRLVKTFAAITRPLLS